MPICQRDPLTGKLEIIRDQLLIPTGLLSDEVRLTCNQKEEKLKVPKKYIINKEATILFWEDNTKTIVKRSSNDEYNKKLAFLIAYFQKHCGLSKTKANEYLDSLVDEDERQIMKALQEGTLIKDVGQVIENVGNSILNYGKN